tara:strand:- start:8011 stop:8322 length:312 start_codon:yes stop_codon:yes gene_type:complete
MKKYNLNLKGELKLNNNDQVSIVTKSKKIIAKNHITKKSWGYYLTDSCNKTLKQNGFKTAIVISYLSRKKKFFVKIVHKNKVNLFNKYLKKNKSKIFMWLDEK